ncbi:coilin-like [Patiria miniata]|uniref:Coilin n=1 Tax=Patiria miniata TaxID=46514 RepID=A0A914AL92_PATMI|nr:coilin-like [Patiria miniata]
MAASMRLRLHFDGNVCTQLSPRKCWFLVNLDNCNIVADLEYLIRERFQLDRGLNIHLYLDDFLLPSMEKIHVIRDNDTLWVKLTEIEDHLLQRLDASPTPPSEPNANEEILSTPERQQKKRSKSKTKKRKSSSRSPENSHRKQKSCKFDNNLDQETVGADGIRVQTKRQKLRHKKKLSNEKTKDFDKEQRVDYSDESLKPTLQHCDASDDVDKTNTTLKSKTGSSQDHQKKPGKKPSKQDSPTTTSKSKRKEKKRSKAGTERNHDNLKKAKLGERSSEGSNSSKKHESASETRNFVDKGSEKQGKVAKLSGVVSNGSTPKLTDAVTSGGSQDGIVEATADQSSSDGRKMLNGPRKNKLTPVCLSVGHIRFDSASESDSNSSSENLDQVIEEPAKKVKNKEQINSEIVSENSVEKSPTASDQPLTEYRTTEGSVPAPSERDILEVQPPPSGQVTNKGQFQRNSSPSPRGAFGARGRGFAIGNRGNWDKKSQFAAVQSNKSVIIQNSPAEPAPPPKDFTSFPSLVGPPRQGDVIAYKILELSESYCPELSDFKEATVLSVDVPSGKVEVELPSVAMVTKPSKQGKFDLQWEDEEDSEAVCSDKIDQHLTVCLQLQDLVDPRLVPSTSA